ncbi:hypothetical protein V8F20_007314 [Naviculisporaceae sp. PSN 640]
MANPNRAPAPTANFAWRQMLLSDIPGLVHVGEVVHPSLPESPTVFTERATLFPDGCLVLTDSDHSNPSTGSCPEPAPRTLYGYAISHPIPYNTPPALDSLLGSIPADPPQYYIHDVAILPEFRGRGLAEKCIRQLLEVARVHGYQETALVSVYGTSKFWGRYGFEPPEDLAEVLKEKIKGYGDDAMYMASKTSS